MTRTKCRSAFDLITSSIWPHQSRPPSSANMSCQMERFSLNSRSRNFATNSGLLVGSNELVGPQGVAHDVAAVSGTLALKVSIEPSARHCLGLKTVAKALRVIAATAFEFGWRGVMSTPKNQPLESPKREGSVSTDLVLRRGFELGPRARQRISPPDSA
jgi:hypothetical protein